MDASHILYMHHALQLYVYICTLTLDFAQRIHIPIPFIYVYMYVLSELDLLELRLARVADAHLERDTHGEPMLAVLVTHGGATASALVLAALESEGFVAPVN